MAIQFKHIDLGANRITIFGKGATVQKMPFRWERTRLELERYILEERPDADEYLLHPERYTRRGSWPDFRIERVRDDKRRFQSYSPTGFYTWWRDATNGPVFAAVARMRPAIPASTP